MTPQSPPDTQPDPQEPSNGAPGPRRAHYATGPATSGYLPEHAGRIARLSALLALGATHYSRWVRRVRLAKYAAYGAGSVLSIPYPSILVSGAFTRDFASFAYVWSAIFLIGALCSLLGVLTKTWVGEYVGLWGVFFALSLYSLACFTVDPTGQRVFIGLVFFGFSMSSVARWQDVNQQKRIAEYRRRVRDGRRGA